MGMPRTDSPSSRVGRATAGFAADARNLIPLPLPRRSCAQPTPVFIEKAHQLYEMILVRHGLMLVGYSFGAKTSIYKSLAGALARLEEEGGFDEHKVQIKCLNPKSIYMGQLYGNFDPVSHEWQDGVLAKLFRDAAVDTAPDRKWVMFDGPVDAIWIENMNTVLDDNKKLCLNSGEIIQMSSTMNMIFEVQDLLVASPATVSRCGMVYVEPSQIGWRPLVKSWLARGLPQSLEEFKARVHALMEWLVDPCLRFIRKNCRELVPTTDINMVVSLMNMFICQCDSFQMRDGDKGTPVGLANKKEVPKLLDGMFLFALVWSIGAATETNGRNKFSAFLRKLVAGEVDKSAERSDFDLGPGLEINDPGLKVNFCDTNGFAIPRLQNAFSCRLRTADG